MITHGFTKDKIAKAVPYTFRIVRRALSRYMRYRTTKMSPKHTGTVPKKTPTIQTTLCHRLATKSDIGQGKIVNFITNKFREEVSVNSILRPLDKHNIALKIMRRVAKQQRPALQYFYEYWLRTLRY
ncbi:hypothetical protein GQ53DRAFT_857619 [Thozetella sp. PMI_491]|nr:hypothetical protein GQ53DRAFT_857619 [Thozetella sp. PMI_491]